MKASFIDGSHTLVTVLSQVLTWILVIAGWWVIHAKTLERERRRENREATAKIIQELSGIELDAMKFHRAAHYNGDDAEALMWRLNRAIRTLQRPPLMALQIETASLSQLRQYITLRNFDRSSFTSQDHDSEILKDIRFATDHLIDEIESSRDRVFV